MFRKILIFVLFLGATFGTQAQTSDIFTKKLEEPKEKKSLVHSVNITAGIYSPEMDYWNDNYLPVAGSSNELGLNMTLGGNINFTLATEFRARVGISYWADNVEESGVGFNELKVSLTRFSFGGLYVPEFAAFGENLQAYAGVEMYYIDINNTLDMKAEDNVVNSSDQNGHDMTFAPVIGLEKLLGMHILIAAEFSYMIGEYTQAEIVKAKTKKVSVNGPQLTFSIGYKF